ncbi:hypothetical protein PHISCL_00046 [Aspergillus sclerotialis]|uniref:Uncharacterized protein n=1 Tax=Aspergillus sclerotialis TaxID=2070753 RepID=A0A3A3AE80_9EURO|nr:hypothetical protein PHISCL_00046 [Aspergillus sclerotialis]
MKDARLPSIQFVARENLALFHKGLRSLSDTWWMAAVMTHLGRHALENTRIQESQEHLDQPGGSTAQSGAVVGSEPPIADLLNSSNAYYTPQQDSSALENPCNSEGNINYPDENFQGTGFSSELDYLLGRYDLASAEEGYFDNFFENFLDVNLPSSLGEQFLGDPHALV